MEQKTLTELRNHFYDTMPSSGDITAWDMITWASQMFKEFDEYIDATPSPAKAEHSFNRDENSLEGSAAIEFYEWMRRTSMAKTDIPVNIKWRMFVDQLNAKQRNNP